MITTEIDWEPPKEAVKRPPNEIPGNGHLIFAIGFDGRAHLLSSNMRVYTLPVAMEEAALVNVCDLQGYSLLNALEAVVDAEWETKRLGNGGVYRIDGTLTPEVSVARVLKGKITTILPGKHPEEP